MGKSGVLENKSDNISKTRKDRGKVTMDGLQELVNALSNGAIPDPLRPHLVWGIASDRSNFGVPPINSGTDKAMVF